MVPKRDEPIDFTLTAIELHISQVPKVIAFTE